MADTFQVLPVRFQFRAMETVLFPPGKSGNIVRGAFGSIFRRLVCRPQCRDPRTCEIREACPYARVFEPRLASGRPSGLSDWPRPFVFRAHHLDGRSVEPGESFHFDLHLFEVREPWLAHFAHSFEQLAREGLGPGRGRATLTRLSGTFLDAGPPTPLSLDLSPGATRSPNFSSASSLRPNSRAERPWRKPRVRDPVRESPGPAEHVARPLRARSTGDRLQGHGGACRTSEDDPVRDTPRSGDAPVDKNRAGAPDRRLHG